MDGTNIKVRYEYFTDAPVRVASFENWAQKRAVWVEREKRTARIRNAFNGLFDIYNLRRNFPDAFEFAIGNGLLSDKQNREIRRLLFLKRANLTLNSNNALILADIFVPLKRRPGAIISIHEIITAYGRIGSA